MHDSVDEKAAVWPYALGLTLALFWAGLLRDRVVSDRARPDAGAWIPFTAAGARAAAPFLASALVLLCLTIWLSLTGGAPAE